MKPAPLLMLAAAGSALMAQAAPPAPTPATSPYQPLAFLIGHCWLGTFPGGAVTDEHCFSWVYGDKFVRDRHVVHKGAGREDQLGESLYMWDASHAQLRYLYIESAGGFSQGAVKSSGDTLVFPPTHYAEDGQEQIYRSRWQRAGEHGYDVITEFQVKGVWTPGFSMHMQQVDKPATG
jgi:hypothetical protein